MAPAPDRHGRRSPGLGRWRRDRAVGGAHGLRRHAGGPGAACGDGRLGRLSPRGQPEPALAEQAQQRLRRLALGRGGHLEGAAGDGLFRPQRRPGREDGRRCRGTGGRGPVSLVAGEDRGGVREGVCRAGRTDRRAAEPVEDQRVSRRSGRGGRPRRRCRDADRLRPGFAHGSGAGGSARGRPGAAGGRYRGAGRAHDRVYRGGVHPAAADGERAHRPGLQAAALGALPELGLHDPQRGDDDLGALGRLDGGGGLPDPGDELVQPLLAGLGRGVALPLRRRDRPRSGAAGVCPRDRPPTARWRPHLGAGHLPRRPRRDRQRLGTGRRDPDVARDHPTGQRGDHRRPDERSGCRDGRGWIRPPLRPG